MINCWETSGKPLGASLLERCSFLWGLHIVGMSWSVLNEKFILNGKYLFSQVILPEIRIGSFSQKCRYSGAKNKLKTGAFPRMSNCLIKHLNLLDYCKYFLSVCYFFRKQANTANTSICKENKYILTRILNFARILWIYPLD